MVMDVALPSESKKKKEHKKFEKYKGLKQKAEKMWNEKKVVKVIIGLLLLCFIYIQKMLFFKWC